MVRLSLFTASAPVAAGTGAAAGAGFTGDDLGGGAFGAGNGAFAAGVAPVAGRKMEGDGRAGAAPGFLMPPGNEVADAMGARGGGGGGGGSSEGAASTAGGGAAVASLSTSIAMLAGGGSLPGNASPRPATLETWIT